MPVDAAGDHRHDAASRADLELRGLGAECVLRHLRGIFHHDLESAAWIGSPHAAVLGAERAGAGAGGNLDRVRIPGEGEGDVAAVALAVDQHCPFPSRRSMATRRPEHGALGPVLKGRRPMIRRTSLAAVSASLLLVAYAAPLEAQTTKSVAGTYSVVKIPAYGDNARGMLVLDGNGNYSIIAGRTTLPKVAAGSRTKGTPEENKAVVDGSI